MLSLRTLTNIYLLFLSLLMNEHSLKIIAYCLQMEKPGLMRIAGIAVQKFQKRLKRCTLWNHFSELTSVNCISLHKTSCRTKVAFFYYIQDYMNYAGVFLKSLWSCS